MHLSPVWAAAPLCALLACSSSSAPAGSGLTTGDDLDGAAGPVADGAAALSMDSGAGSAADAAKDAPATTGNAAAGKAGADAFCMQICDHEQTCAGALDASTSGLADCLTSCESSNEAAMASPPTELLRADYVSALGTCIAGSSCQDALQTAESDCATSAVSGTGGGAPITPTAAAMAFCHAFTSSACGADAGTQACESSFMLYADATLNAAVACFAMSTCAEVDACYAAAFAQP